MVKKFYIFPDKPSKGHSCITYVNNADDRVCLLYLKKNYPRKLTMMKTHKIQFFLTLSLDQANDR